MQLFDNIENSRVLSLEELAKMIEGIISSAFDRGYWVKAEMARLNLYPQTGHCYPDLVEKEGNTIKAQMRGTIWAGTYQKISKQFMEVAREPLRDGLQILFFASVRFHPQYGLSLQINDIDPSYTLGQMARERMETIRKLKESSLFDLNRNLSFPPLPKRIAVISVSTSKGYSDFMNILEKRAGNFRFLVKLFPALLQGDKAVDSITAQLKEIRKSISGFDVVAIIRGGGGEVGLSCYDDYRLAREVATFPIPVLTGIGHSTNETVVEMVAAANMITPTDVAYSLVARFQVVAERLEQISNIVSDYARELITGNKTLLRDLVERLQEQTRSRLDQQRLRMDMTLRDTLQQTRLLLRSEKEKFVSSLAVLRLGPKRSILREKDILFNQVRWLAAGILAGHEKENARIRLAESRLNLLDPVNTLKRGFSITYYRDKPLKDASSVEPGDVITSQLYKGKIRSIVKSKEK